MITSEVREGAMWVTIDRPEKNNAIPPAGNRELLESIERGSEHASVVVITGTGWAFSAGSDVDALRRARADGEIAAAVEAECQLYQRIKSLDVPILAAVNGFAYGGGFELVLACDLAVAVEGATFALPETRLGVTPGYALDTATEHLGRKRTLELALTGERIDAETAREWGVVNRVVERDVLHEAVAEIVAQVHEAPPYAIAAVKRTVNEDVSERVSFQRSVDRLSALLSVDETQSRIDQFLK